MNVLQELSDDFLTCSICLEKYTEPKQLPCLHSFCRGCLSGYIKTNDNGGILVFPCPVCRSNTSPTSSLFADPADDFPDNFYIASLVSSFSKKAALEPKQPLSNDNCVNHLDNISETFCTKTNAGVCHECQAFHRNCQEHHLSLHAAKNKAFSDVAVLKVKMTSLQNHSKRLNESLLDTPNNFRLRKEEIVQEISKHFSEIKISIAKKLIDKEKETINRLNDVFKEEVSWNGDAVKENLAIGEACENKIKLLDDQSTQRSMSAIGVLHSMDDLVQKFTADISRLETESDTNLIKYIPNENPEDAIEQISFGKICSVHTEEECDSESVSPAADDIEKPLVTGASATPTMRIPSAPPMSYSQPQPGNQQAPAWDLNQYRGQPYAPMPMNYNPVITPTHGAYGGMVIKKPNEPPRPKPNPANRFGADRMYLQSHKAPTVTEGITKLVQTAKLSCRHPSDTRACKFVGITPVAIDVFVVADRWNKTLKLMRLKGPSVKLLQLRHDQEPWDATRILTSKRDEIAVTFPATKLIVFVEYTDVGLNPGTQIKTRTGYASLGCLSFKELVCGICKPFGQPGIDIISMDGTVLKSFPDVVTYPRSIDTSPGRVIVVSDWFKKQVLLMNEDGRVLATYKGGHGHDLKDPKGVAYHEDGCFLIVDEGSGCIHKINEAGFHEMVVRATDNAVVIACVFASPKFSKEGLAVVTGTSNGCVICYDGSNLVNYTENQ